MNCQMKCEEFENRLNQLLDDRLVPEWDAELRAHASDCGECRELARHYTLLLDGYAALVAPEPSPELAARVLDQLQAERPRTAQRLALAVGMFATAAALLVAVLPMFSGSEPEVKIAQSEPAEKAATGPRTDLRNRQLTVNAARQLSSWPMVGPALQSVSAPPKVASDPRSGPYANLAKETGKGLATVALALPNLGGTLGLVDVGRNVANEPSLPEPVSDGLRPLTQTVSETLDLLLSVIPGHKAVATRS